MDFGTTCPSRPTFSIANAAVVNQAGANALANFATNAAAGRLTLRNGRELTTPGAFANAGTVVLDGGGLRVTGAYTQTAGRTTLRDGGVEATLFDLQGGVLGNLRNAARLDVGGANAIGFLFVVGDYTQTSAGALHIDLAGRELLTTYDLLYATGAVALDGTLDVNLLSGFVPEPDDLFVPIIGASLTGQFATINGLEFGTDGAFLPFYTDAVFVLYTYRR